MTALKPLILQGTTSFAGGRAIVFQIIDPTYRIPMVWEVVTAEFGKDNYQRTYRPQVKSQSEQVLELFDKLQSCQGIDRLWVTPTLIVAAGNEAHFDAVAEEIKKVIGEVLGKFNVQSVGDNQVDVNIGLLMSKAA